LAGEQKGDKMNNREIKRLIRHKLSVSERFHFFLEGMLVGSIMGTGILVICLIIFKIGLCG